MARRTLTVAPLMVRIVCLAALVLAAFSLTNLAYQIVSKPSELLYFVGDALDEGGGARERGDDALMGGEMENSSDVEEYGFGCGHRLTVVGENRHGTSTGPWYR